MVYDPIEQHHSNNCTTLEMMCMEYWKIWGNHAAPWGNKGVSSLETVCLDDRCLANPGVMHQTADPAGQPYSYVSLFEFMMPKLGLVQQCGHHHAEHDDPVVTQLCAKSYEIGRYHPPWSLMTWHFHWSC